ncbi:sensor histidine kinase [Deefgea rivuli]|uniref:sensor histidine kinase n=1 Tax=Deefgea rivuli TaxID=400948 RepID=UPI000683ED05|nr:GAF domain-containing sensor histidine kinase [Deefgea rivuli]
MTDFNFIPAEFTAQLAQIEATWAEQPDAAQVACEALIASARAQREPLCQIYATELYGLIMNNKGQSVPARDLLYEAVQQAQALHNFPLEARVHEQIARSHYTAGDYRTALNHWLRSVALAELANAEPTTWISAQIGLGQIYDALNDPATAVVFFQTAAARVHEVNDPYLDAKIQINLGVVFFKCQRNADAKQALNDASEICLREHFYDYAAESNFRLAEVFIQEAELDTAMALLEQALAHSHKAKHRWSEANIYSAIAQIYALRKDWAQALQQVLIGQEISHNNEFLHVLMRQHLAAADYAEQLQQLPLALAQFKSGFQLQQKINAAAQPDQHQELEQKTGMRANASHLLLDLANHPAIEHGKLTEFPHVICQAATQILAIARVGLWQRHTDSLQCIALHLHDEAISEAPLQQSQLPTFFNWLSEHKSLIAHDALHHPDAWDLAEHYLLPRDIHSILAFPIWSGAEQYVLLFEHLGNQRNWLPDDVQHASQLADITSRALANHDRHTFQREIHLLNARLIEANDALETRVTERTQTLELAMDKLVQSEKLAALGSLVAGIAHELNTPLGAALTCSTTLSAESRELHKQMLSNTLKKSSLENYAHTMADASALIERNINRAIELVCDFKQVAVDTASSRRREFDLLGTVNDVVKMFNGQIRHTQHQLSIDIPAHIQMDSYPGPFEQVIANLINNSLLHGFEKKSAGRIRLSAQQNQAGWVDFCFEDNGCGIKLTLHKKVFEPFYTTKLGKGGSGLGMYITYNIVTGVLGGELTLESEAEQYTRFNIKLPLVAPLLSDTEKNAIER